MPRSKLPAGPAVPADPARPALVRRPRLGVRVAYRFAAYRARRDAGMHPLHNLSLSFSVGWWTVSLTDQRVTFRVSVPRGARRQHPPARRPARGRGRRLR
jgi:hypothetical protein